MRRILLSTLFCSLFSVACSPPPDKCPRTDDLSKDWSLESQDPLNKIAVSWQCPQTIEFSLHSKEGVLAYAARITKVERDKPVSMVGTFTSMCSPEDGFQAVSIFEGGSKVAYRESKLLSSQQLRVDYTPTSNQITYIAGVSSNQPCDVSLQLVVTQ